MRFLNKINTLNKKKYPSLLFLLMIFFQVNFSIQSFGVNTYSGASGGNWSANGNWSAGHFPAAGEDIVIPNGKTVNLDVNSTVIATLTIQGTGILNLNTASKTLTTTGNVTLAGTSSISDNASTNTCTISVGGDLVVAASTDNVSIYEGVTLTVTGAVKLTGALTIIASKGHSPGYTMTAAVTAYPYAGTAFSTPPTLYNCTCTNFYIYTTGSIGSNAGNGAWAFRINGDLNLSGNAVLGNNTNRMLYHCNTFTVQSAAIVTFTRGDLYCTGAATVNGTVSANSTAGVKWFTSLTMAANSAWGGSSGEKYNIINDFTLNPPMVLNNSAGTCSFYTGGKLIVNNGGAGNYADIQNSSQNVAGLFQIDGNVKLSTSSAGNHNFYGGITVSATGTFSNLISDNYSIGGNVSNSGTWNASAAGTETVTFTPGSAGTVSYTISGNAVNFGIMAITNNGAGNTTTVTNTCNLTLTGSASAQLTGTGNFTNGNGSYLTLMGGATPVTLSGTFLASTVSNTVEYAKVGAQNIFNTTYNKLTLTGNSTKSSTANATVNGLLTVNNTATFDMTGFTANAGSLAGSGIIQNSNASTKLLTVGSDNTSTTYSGTIINVSGTQIVQLTKTGTGALTLSGTNTYTGGTTLSAGTININNSQALGAATSAFAINAGTTIDNTTGGAITTVAYPQTWNGDFTFTGTNDLNLSTGAVTMGANVQVTTSTAAKTLTVGGTINNAIRNLTKAGPGILAFANQAVTLNTLTINAGTLTSTSGTLSLAGDFTNNSTYTHSSGTVSFDGTAAQTIGGSTATPFYNVTFNNDPVTAGDVTLSTNNYTVNNQVTMTQGNVNLNGLTLTLGTSTASPGTLSYTSGFFYSNTGTFKRWVSATSATIGAVAANELAHFPMGTAAGGYRPLWLTYTADLATGGTVSVLHDGTTLTTGASHTDVTWNGGTVVDAVTNSFWTISTANGFALAGATGSIRYGGTGYGTNTLSDLDATLAASAPGTFAPATSAITTIEVNRTGLSTSAATFANSWRIGTKNVPQSPLPIELLSFSAKRNNNIVNLNWSTATEKNNNFFTIEKSRDGNNFEFVSTVKGAGNSTTVLKYASVDSTPYAGVSYYRLKQTDYDGKYTYSGLVSVEFTNTNNFNFIVYPNPTDGSAINLSINSLKDKEILVVVYDALGRIQYSKVVITQNDGNNVYVLDSSGKLSSGIYFITATSDQTVFSKKLVVK